MKVTLVCPPNILPARSLISVRPPTPSTSVPYLQAFLKRGGHEATTIDALGLGIDQVRPVAGTPLYVRGLIAEEIVAKIPPGTELLGFSCMFSNEWVYVKRIIRAAKQRFPGIPIVVGGEHVSADTEYVFASAAEVDFAVIGEGEETLLELADALESGGSLPGIAGLAFRVGGEVAVNTARKRNSAVSELPWPVWDDIPLERYFALGSGITSFKGRIMPMLASRGCPFHCTFCSNPSMWGARWLAREVSDVIGEMKFYLKRFRVTHIEFHDLTAIVNRKWILEFTNALIAENLGITWSLPSGTRSEALDQEVVRNLYRSGCKKIAYAPESGSTSTLRKIKKRVNLEKMVRSMKWSVREGIVIRAHIIIGFPDQTLAEVWDSLRFIFRLAWIGVHDVSIYFFVPYPGSELFRALRAEGKIPRDFEAYEKFLVENVANNTKAVSWSGFITDFQLKWISFFGMAMFYLCQFLFRPVRFGETMVRFVKRQPTTILDGLLYGLFWSKATQMRQLPIAGTENEQSA